MKIELKFIRKYWLGLLILAALIVNNSAAVTYYFSIHVPQEKTILYSATAYIDGIEWTNGTKLVWNTSNVKELDVINLGTVNASVYLITEGLPTGWNLNWSSDGLSIAPNEWLNGTLTLEPGSEPGIYNWDSWIVLSP